MAAKTDRSKVRGRGGARNYPKADVCTYTLGEALKDYVKKTGLARSFELSPYGHLPRTAAANGRGLVKALDLITACYEVEPSLQFKFSDIKEALHVVQSHFGDDIGKGADWCRKTTQTVMTVFTHARRLKDDVRYREASSKLTDHEQKLLAKVRAMVLGEPEVQDEGSVTSKQKAKEQKHTEETEEEDVKKKRRTGKEEDPLDIPQTPKRRRDLDMIRCLEIPQTPSSVQGSFSQAANDCSPVPTKKAVLKDRIMKKPSSQDTVPEACSIAHFNSETHTLKS